jgi:glutaminyl-peptide cyclotransferase
MEIANHLTNLPSQWGVDLVLFDAEELVFGNNVPHEDYFLGSKEFARIYAGQVRGKRTQMRYENGIVIDLAGGRNLNIKREPASARAAPQLMSDLWRVAGALQIDSFRAETGREVSDDHLALIEAGIPTVDLIDFDYPFWHTADDLPENCSAESMADVARVVTTWLTLPPRSKTSAGNQRSRTRRP